MSWGKIETLGLEHLNGSISGQTSAESISDLRLSGRVVFIVPNKNLDLGYGCIPAECLAKSDPVLPGEELIVRAVQPHEEICHAG